MGKLGICGLFLLLHITWFHFQVARKLAMVEADLERAEERAESGESYVVRVIFCVLHVSFTDCFNEYI